MVITASVAGRCNLRMYFAISTVYDGRNSVVILVLNLYFLIFNGQQFRSGQAMKSRPSTIPVRCAQSS